MGMQVKMMGRSNVNFVILTWIPFLHGRFRGNPLNCNPECHVTQFFLSSFSLAGIFFFLLTLPVHYLLSLCPEMQLYRSIKCLRVGFFLEVYQVTPWKTLTLHYIAHND